MLDASNWSLDLGPVDDVLHEGRIVVRVGASGESVLVVRTRRGVFAMQNECPHMGLPLDDAAVHGSRLTCAHHGYRYDLTSGRCRAPGVPRALTLRTYRAWIERGHLMLSG
jgi:3-phenylpropionate/trans-cinnamate dioxygenase ferredoxin subunit